MNRVIDKPRIGETVLFETGGRTHSGSITSCDDKGNIRVQPSVPINGLIVMENLRRPAVSGQQVLSEEEVLAKKLKSDGQFAIQLSKDDPIKYKVLMKLITSGVLNKA